MGKQKDIHQTSSKRKEKKFDKALKSPKTNHVSSSLKNAELVLLQDLESFANSKRISRKFRKDLERYPPLAKAAFLGSEKVIDLILDAGENLNAQVSDGSTPLILAVENGHTGIVEKLLKKGADPRLLRQDGRNSLMIAVAKNDNISFTLVWNYWDKSRYCDLNHQDLQGYTVLSIAAEHGHSHFIQFLLSLVRIDIDKQTEDGQSPLMLAVLQRQAQDVRRLINSGADAVLEDKRGATAICLAVCQNVPGIKSILTETMDNKSKEEYVKKRIELLSKPKTDDISILMPFYKEILFYVILDIGRRFKEGMALLEKHEVFMHLLICMERNQQDFELLRIGFHLVACLIYDKPEHSTYIAEELAEQYIQAKGLEFSLRILSGCRLKCLSNLRGAATLPIHASGECHSGKSWLKLNYYQLKPLVEEFREIFPTMVFWVEGERLKSKIMLERFEEIFRDVGNDLKNASQLRQSGLHLDGTGSKKGSAKTVLKISESDEQKWSVVSHSKSNRNKSVSKETMNPNARLAGAKKKSKKKSKSIRLQTKLQRTITAKKTSPCSNVQHAPHSSIFYSNVKPNLTGQFFPYSEENLVSQTGYADALKRNLKADIEEKEINGSLQVSYTYFPLKNSVTRNQDKPQILEGGDNQNKVNSDEDKVCRNSDKVENQNSSYLLCQSKNFVEANSISKKVLRTPKASNRKRRKSVVEFLMLSAQKQSERRKGDDQCDERGNSICAVTESISTDLQEFDKTLTYVSPQHSTPEPTLETKAFYCSSFDEKLQRRKCEGISEYGSGSSLRNVSSPEANHKSVFDDCKDSSLCSVMSFETKESETLNGNPNHSVISWSPNSIIAESPDAERDQLSDEEADPLEGSRMAAMTESFDVSNLNHLETLTEVNGKAFLLKQRLYEFSQNRDNDAHKRKYEDSGVRDIIFRFYKEDKNNLKNSIFSQFGMMPKHKMHSVTLNYDKGQIVPLNLKGTLNENEAFNSRADYKYYRKWLDAKSYRSEFPFRLNSLLASKHNPPSILAAGDYFSICGKVSAEADFKIFSENIVDSGIIPAYTQVKENHKIMKEASEIEGYSKCFGGSVAHINSKSGQHKQNMKSLCYKKFFMFNIMNPGQILKFEALLKHAGLLNRAVSRKVTTKLNNLQTSCSSGFRNDDNELENGENAVDYNIYCRHVDIAERIQRSNSLLATKKDYDALLPLKNFKFHGRSLRKLKETSKPFKCINRNGIRWDKIRKRKQRRIEAYDCMGNGLAPVIGSDVFGCKPYFIKCEQRSKWYTILKGIYSCVPLASFLENPACLGKRHTECFVHELVCSSGKITFSSKEEHILRGGEYGTYLGILDNGNPLVVRQFHKSSCDMASLLSKKYRVNHKSIVNFYCISGSLVGPTFFCVTDMCEYSLQEYVENGLVALDEKIMVRDLVEAIKYLHEKRIVHGFLKPSNVMVTLDDRIKVTEFYLMDVSTPTWGVVTKREHESHVAVGSALPEFCWRPYELISATGEEEARQLLTAAADIQMTGMLVYFMLSGGRHPFGSLDFRCQENILCDNPELDPAMAEVESIDLAKTMIKRNPSLRPSMNRVLLHPYFWSKERRFQFLIAVAKKSEFFTRKPTKLAETLHNSCLEARDWTSCIEPPLMMYVNEWMNRIHKDNFADLLLFALGLHDSFDMMPLHLKHFVHQPSVFVLQVFPTIFMSVYSVIREDPLVQRQMTLQTYF